MTNPDREELLCYADSLNQQANWIEEALAPETPDSQRIGIEDIDIDELRGASDLLRRLAEIADCFADQYDAITFTSTTAEQVAALRAKEQAANEIAAAIRSGGAK